MCNTRAFRYGCGHASYRHLSSCRGTYADPKGNSTLCHASPSLTVSVSMPCSNCLYREFRDTWEARLSAAQEKHYVASQMMYEMQDDGECCGELSDGLIGGRGLNDCFGDAQAADRERQRAEEELRRLKQQYERELALQWASFNKGHKQPSRKAPPRMRRPSPKRPGSSPLRQSESFDVVAVDTSVSSKRKSSTRASRSPSLTSDSSSSSDFSIEDIEFCEEPESLLTSSWPLPDAMDWKESLAGISSSTTKELPFGIFTTIAAEKEEDDYDQLLPHYGF